MLRRRAAFDLWRVDRMGFVIGDFDMILRLVGTLDDAAGGSD